VSHVSNWIWKDGKAPGPQTARAGETFIFHLPLMGTGPAPSIDWMDVPPGLTVAPLPEDNLSFAIHIPADLVGIQRLRYRRAGEPRADELLLKILPPRSSQPVSNPEVFPDSGSPSIASAQSGPPIQGRRINPSADPAAKIPTPAEIRDRRQSSATFSQDFHRDLNEVTRGIQAGSRLPEMASALATDAQEPQRTVSAPEVNALTSAPRLDPNREYEIQVYRQGVRIPQLSRPLTPHKSLLVGKFSASRMVIPDIDLRSHFVNNQAEALCSRQQARIYWSHDRILLHNLGKSAIDLPNGLHLAKDEVYAWTPGEEAKLPGGLTLHLAMLTY